MSLTNLLTDMFQLFQQARLIPRRALLPHETVLVGVGLYFRAVYKQMLIANLTLVAQKIDQSVEKKLCARGQALTAKSRYFVIVGGFCSVEQPDEVDVPFAGAFDITAGIDAFHVGIQHDLKQRDGVGCGLTTEAFVGAPQ